MTALMASDVARRVAQIIPRLATSHDGEVIATARAIGRVLHAGGADWHDLADAISPKIASSARGDAGDCPTCHATSRETLLAWINSLLNVATLSAWEIGFLTDMHEMIARRPYPQLTGRQIEIVDKLLARSWNAGMRV
jgi:hypothetical protein